MPECDICEEDCYYHEDLIEHLNVYDHWIECETCDREFISFSSRNQHMDAVSHWRERFHCETCSRVFFSESAAENHMNALGHWKNYCESCGRQFQDENSLRMHLNSRIHRGTQVKCPFCTAQFVTASGVSHHLESGSCPKASNLNRHTIAQIIQRLDTGGLIANKQIEWRNENNVRYEATNRSFNGRSWECYLCHRGFATCTSLNQHLNSPAHAQKAYHCPNRRGCAKEFASLAGLFNHLESESCEFMRFNNVQATHKMLTDSIMGNRRIAAF